MNKTMIKKLVDENVYPTFKEIANLIQEKKKQEYPFPIFDKIFFEGNEITAKCSYIHIPNANHNELSEYTLKILKEVEDMLENKALVFCKRDPIDDIRNEFDNLYKAPLVDECTLINRIIRLSNEYYINCYIKIIPENGKNKFHLNSISVCVPPEFENLSIRTSNQHFYEKEEI